MEVIIREIQFVMKLKQVVLVVIPLCLASFSWARPPISASLPMVAYADTETVTNVPFTAMLDRAGRFTFNLSCLATPSNNVEAAFGTDANSNGILELAEIDRIVGCDCGAWFTRRRADGLPVSEETVSSDPIRTLTWKLQIDAEGQPSHLEVRADGMPVFTGLALDDVYKSSWNLLRFTGRGLDVSSETFTVTVTPDGTTVLVR